MTSDRPPEKSEDLPARLFQNFYFAVSWLIFLALMVTFVAFPIRNIVLVCWLHGRDGYFRDGIRVLKGKPTSLSTGELVPTLPDLVTGFGAFFMTVIPLSLLLVFVLRSYERHFGRKRKTAAE